MKKVKNDLPSRLSSEHVLAAAVAVWSDQLSAVEDISSAASKIIGAAYEKAPAFFSGRSEKGILSGLFYRLAFNTVNVKTQKEIASALHTNELTIRASSREWLEVFPELFPT